MANMRKVEEGNALPEKRKLDLPDSKNETPKQKAELQETSESESSKRQKLEIPEENETNIIHSFLIDGKMAETGQGKEDSEDDQEDDKDKHLEVEEEIAYGAQRYTAAEKGKGILIEESDEEEYDYDDDSSDDSDCDFFDGLDSGSEDIPF